MATFGDLTDALVEALRRRGVLGKIQAMIRAEIFHALDEQDLSPPAVIYENLVINELFREYLEFHKNYHTLSVFLA
eukprot:Cvel_6720.t1-p1 / transcript=Cvel_6720.t1 / gene=Cvel_6720 / organism=Chromera_velia_CCMP2878 / gene_product=LisH domain-containing protein FOPNL, putative / transcript_product=LisH domain-containing protein FOPNL, putative / location=Cvel_scaffold335:97012-97809(+) / protein_length=75 / sequence_SO=supercontig / SO=protein_coding / is_pseudo=false